jgi:hypothetical protein
MEKYPNPGRRSHYEKNLEDWLIKIVKERIQLEEVVLNNIKQELAQHHH